MNKTIGAVLVLALATGIFLGVHQNHRAALQPVAFATPAGTTIKIYRDLGGDGGINYDPHSKPVTTLTSSQKVELKLGTYDWVADDPASKYDSPAGSFTVVGPQNVVIAPKLKATQLASLLSSSRSEALAALAKKYPTYTTYYHMIQDQLFLDGSWYAALIQPTDTSADNLRVVLHKTGDDWKVMTDPPHITVGAPSHPDIPLEVVKGANALTGQQTARP